MHSEYFLSVINKIGDKVNTILGERAWNVHELCFITKSTKNGYLNEHNFSNFYIFQLWILCKSSVYFVLTKY